MSESKFRKVKRAVVKEEYVAITDYDIVEAMLLNQMIYWSKRVNDYDKFIGEERKRVNGQGEGAGKLPFRYGWIYKSASDLKNEIMNGESRKTISRKMSDLVKRGFLDRRSNPQVGYDRTYQYRVNYPNIVRALGKMGYKLEEEIKFEDTKPDREIPSSGQNDKWGKDKGPVCDDKGGKKHIEPAWCAADIGQNVRSVGQNVQWTGHGGHSEGQHVHAIPEITSETTSKTVPPSYSPLHKNANEDEGIFKKIGKMKNRKYIEPMKAAASDILRNGSGKDSTLSFLTPEILDGIAGRFDRRSKTGQINAPAKYMESLILNARRDCAFFGLKGGDEKKTSFDVDEYVRLSIKRLDGQPVA